MCESQALLREEHVGFDWVVVHSRPILLFSGKSNWAFGHDFFNTKKVFLFPETKIGCKWRNE